MLSCHKQPCECDFGGAAVVVDSGYKWALGIYCQDSFITVRHGIPFCDLL